MLPNSNREETEEEMVARAVYIFEEMQKASEARHKAWRENLISRGYSEEDIAQESRMVMEQIKAGTYPESKIHSLEIIPTYRLPELPIVEPCSN